jgi:excisionase family DNA binding protein
MDTKQINHNNLPEAVAGIYQEIDGLKKHFAETISKTITQQAQQPEKYLTREDVAKILDISIPKLRELTKAGKIKGYRIGANIRYKASDVDAALTPIVAAA